MGMFQVIAVLPLGAVIKLWGAWIIPYMWMTLHIEQDNTRSDTGQWVRSMPLEPLISLMLLPCGQQFGIS